MAETPWKILCAADRRSRSERRWFLRVALIICGWTRFICEPGFEALSIEHTTAKYLPSEAHKSSILKLEVYAQRKVGSSDYIGEMEERIEVLLAQKSERDIV